MSNRARLSGDLACSSAADGLRLIQITDTHLTGHADGELLGLNTERSARAVIQAARALERIDCVLVTGDIAADKQPAAYPQLASLLGDDIPSLWLPGNHDCMVSTTPELTAYFKRRLRTPFWDVVMLETQVEGRVGGYLATSELTALAQSIAEARACNKALLVATHHPLRPVSSAWLDQQVVQNASAALALMADYADKIVVISGHVHQASDATVTGIRMLTTPSTCVQFAPNSTEFALDDCPPGYRSLWLRPDGTLKTQINRISDSDNQPMLNASGYD